MIIDYPKSISEFDVQAELYSKLKDKGYDVFGEYRLIFKNQTKGYREYRFDLVIFHNKKAVCIIEVKQYSNFIIDKEHCRQYNKYMMFCLPLLYCLGKENIDKTIIEVDNIFKSFLF